MPEYDIGTQIPKGCILMWSGTIAAIPQGFALCNGSNGTPDLRNKFIVCADADSGGAAKTTILAGGWGTSPTQSGGAVSISLGETETTHTHSFGFGAVSEDLSGTGTDSVVTDDGYFGSTDDGYFEYSFPIIPPFYALAFIMKL